MDIEVPHLVKDSGWDGQRAAGIWHIHYARDAALAGTATQQQDHLPQQLADEQASANSTVSKSCFVLAELLP